MALRIGTAGWSIPRSSAQQFCAQGSLLERYAGRLGAVEINSSFHRPHRRSTYGRWAATVPEDFRFSVKLPRVITHENRLVDCAAPLERFADEVSGLGQKLGVVLVQLPPSLAFDRGPAEAFLAALRRHTGAAVALEPRHPSWFAGPVDALLAGHGVARVGADPSPAPGADEPAGWQGLVYYRLHGSPRMYYSNYDAPALASLARRLRARRVGATPTWCIFDNTAAGAATANALALAALLGTSSVLTVGATGAAGQRLPT